MIYHQITLNGLDLIADDYFSTLSGSFDLEKDIVTNDISGDGEAWGRSKNKSKTLTLNVAVIHLTAKAFTALNQVIAPNGLKRLELDTAEYGKIFGMVEIQSRMTGDSARLITLQLIMSDPHFYELTPQIIQLGSTYSAGLIFGPGKGVTFAAPKTVSGNPLDLSDALEVLSLTVTGHTEQPTSKQGKNLFNPVAGSIAANGVTCTIASGTIKLDGTATADTWFGVSPVLETPVSPKSTWILFSPSAQSYTMSSTVVSGSKTGIITFITKDYITPRTGTTLTLQNSNSAVIDAIPAGAGITYAWIYVSSGAVCSAYQFRVQLEQGSSATTWVPFVPESPSPSYQAPIHGVSKTTVNGTDYALPRALYNLPIGIADGFDVVSGQGTRQIGKMVLNGTENWTREAIDSNSVRWKIIVPDAIRKQSSAGQILCSHYQAGLSTTWSKVQSITLSVIDEGAFYLFDAAHQTSALSDWKAWLAAQYAAGTPVTVLYQLAASQTVTGGPVTIPGTSLVSSDSGAQLSATYDPEHGNVGQGIIFGAPTGASGTVTNRGNVDAYPVIILTGAMSGACIRNLTTGEQIDVGEVALNATDVVVIDCRPETCGVYFNGEAHIERKTSPGWIRCPPGDNQFSFSYCYAANPQPCTVELQSRWM